MRIGELSQSTRASARSLRYYEQIGLISTTRRSNGYREYSEDTVGTVRTIRMLLDLGFPTSLIGEVLSCDASGASAAAGATGATGASAGDCSTVVARMASIRDDMDAKARQLGATSRTLTAFIERASAA
ncbi:MerR family transcriptional regulator [Subtercola sp. YIM 133946]|uniref:MerR family transcriptional regulator n=1 Tax=Subtercola sp. YIM 133946 TaxID=3118909 RepID=UPI002F923494